MHRLKLISRLLFCAALVLTVTAAAVPVPVQADESSDSSGQSLPWPDAPGISAEGLSWSKRNPAPSCTVKTSMKLTILPASPNF